jgi:hypothetical protein
MKAYLWADQGRHFLAPIPLALLPFPFQKGTTIMLLRPANTMMLESRLIQTGLWMTKENQEQLFT